MKDKNEEKLNVKSQNLLNYIVENVPFRVFWKDRESR